MTERARQRQPMTEDMKEKVGRFGHHPDPAIDFCVEVEELQSVSWDRAHHVDNPDDANLEARVAAAMLFRVGGDLNAISAKTELRKIEAALAILPKEREGVAELIDELRASEGAAVTILCDNPDFNGLPNNAVEVVADWTNWQTVRFTGETLTEALSNARHMSGGTIMASTPKGPGGEGRGSYHGNLDSGAVVRTETAPETPESIAAWADETFGKSAPLAMAERAAKEMAELVEAAKLNPAKVPEEIADVQICLMRLAHMVGADPVVEVDRKMAINRGRTWTLNGDGTGQHVPSVAHEATGRDIHEATAYHGPEGDEAPIPAEHLFGPSVAFGMNIDTGPSPAVRELVEAAREACDLLAERKYGSRARSPGHNARLVLERALTALGGEG